MPVNVSAGLSQEKTHVGQVFSCSLATSTIVLPFRGHSDQVIDERSQKKREMTIEQTHIFSSNCIFDFFNEQ